MVSQVGQDHGGQRHHAHQSTRDGVAQHAWEDAEPARHITTLEDVNISLHTMALIRGGRIGAVMYYAKAYYAFEILGNKEWWATYESYNGWSRWGVGMAQPSYPWPDVQHELGGARVYYVTKKYWDKMIKNYVQQMTGTELDFNVPDEVVKANEVMRVPEDILV